MGVIRDLSGQKFGALKFLRRLGADGRRRSIWEAVCDCGKRCEVAGTLATSGHVQSCGCQARNKPVDLTGQAFGRLRVLHLSGLGNSRAFLWLCLCECGSLAEVPGTKLRHGHTKSCGCLSRDLAGSLNLTHGQSKTPTYSTWLAMWSRCTNPKHVGWKSYGGRGIKVCRRWQKFENFLADMGPKPEGLTIERRNNERGYSPTNCCWATQAEQNRNKRPRKPRVPQP